MKTRRLAPVLILVLGLSLATAGLHAQTPLEVSFPALLTLPFSGACSLHGSRSRNNPYCAIRLAVVALQPAGVCACTE